MGITGGLFGLSVTYVLALAVPFEFLVRNAAELETLVIHKVYFLLNHMM